MENWYPTVPLSISIKFQSESLNNSAECITKLHSAKISSTNGKYLYNYLYVLTLYILNFLYFVWCTIKREVLDLQKCNLDLLNTLVPWTTAYEKRFNKCLAFMHKHKTFLGMLYISDNQIFSLICVVYYMFSYHQKFYIMNLTLS